MINNNQSGKSKGNFWLGFLLGMISGAGGLFLFGTKKGRKVLQQLMASAEDLEKSLGDVKEHFGEKLEQHKEIIQKKVSALTEKIPGQNLHSVLEKIKAVFPEKKEAKRYFFKEGKILK